MLSMLFVERVDFMCRRTLLVSSLRSYVPGFSVSGSNFGGPLRWLAGFFLIVQLYLVLKRPFPGGRLDFGFPVVQPFN